MSTPYTAPPVFQPFGLPIGTVRGFLSLLIVSFFWVALLLPSERAVTAPLAHFFLLTLVFLAFASNPTHADPEHHFLPWLMRILFVGGSVLVVGYVAYTDPNRLAVRLTPTDLGGGQWPAYLGTLSGGFAAGLFFRFVLGRTNFAFQTMRAWVGVLAMLLLVFETVLQYLIIPNLTNQPDMASAGMKVWEGVLIALVAIYFGSRA